MDFELYKVVEKSPCGKYVRYNHMLGEGASKKVYFGWDGVEKIDIAWNKIGFRSGEDEEEEAILLKSLNHERVMKCFAYWFDSTSKTLNMITELFPSGSLKEYLSKNYNGVGVDLASIKNWGRQILEGLSFLHGQSPKIIHRDIKCDNVFVDSDGKRVTLGDFGLAVRVKEGDFVNDQQVKCTPEFMAPECFEEEYNELVDVYAFGMCLLEMVTGEYPYMECSNQMQVFKKVFSGLKPASLGQVKDSGVRDIIEKCLLPVSVRPSAEELLKDPFFPYSDASSKLEACAPDVSLATSHRFRGLHCCARVVAWTRKKCKLVQHQKVNPLNLD
ncbi:Serine/threonine-protein kinase WNK8 [Capsicum chinense]|nr:Serine/threonine-protein kinase WNK8 [Capsicum chinense]